jgi:hypothetical protein
VTAPLVFEAQPATSRRARTAALLILGLSIAGFGIAAVL